MKTMTRRSIFAFGICIGVFITCTFGVLAMFIDHSTSYSVYSVDDHAVTLKSKKGVYIEIQLENVPDVSCFEVGSIIFIDYLP